ncbi:multidrug efflux SMR transporter [Rossellomorea aquimaris]|uniref:DMT family transporter n=1 Tax=Rossellomorea aquimaris TaxID=189382 RepID=UPI001CD2E904|nr:multidrug efflux SMR transporter [Rossellomorea aquimaris]MCA1055852.1 multidrug efflux SMR transporter [Rossellomorea aquimaris]
MGYLFLSLVLAAAGNLSVKLSEGFRKRLYSVASFVLIGLCLYFLSLSVRTMEIGIAYAIWSGSSIAITALFGLLFFNEKANPAKFIYIGFVIVGIVILK